MRSLQSFSDAGTPVFADLGRATPALTEATRDLTPFTAASTVALKSLGDAGEAAGPTFRAADPVVKKARDLARSRRRPDHQPGQVPGQHQEDQGLRRPRRPDLQRHRRDQRVRQIRPLHSAASSTLTNCVEYVTAPKSGCTANFDGPGGEASAFDSARRLPADPGRNGGASGGTAATTARPEHLPQSLRPPNRRLNSAKAKGSASASKALEDEEAEAAGERPKNRRPAGRPPQRALLDYLLGP